MDEFCSDWVFADMRARLAEFRQVKCVNLIGRDVSLHLTKSQVKVAACPNSPRAPQAPLWRLFMMPSWFWLPPWRGARSGSLRPRRSTKVDAWRAPEAKSGRIYDCAKRSVAGFPFRLEVRCSGASVALRRRPRARRKRRSRPARRNPGGRAGLRSETLIAEFAAPATISDRGQQPSMAVNWSTAPQQRGRACRHSAACLIVFDDPAIDRINASVQTPVARAKHVELHGRLAEGSTLDRPVIETVLQIDGGSVQELHPLLAAPFDADVRDAVERA